jgi:hypothetical protein
MSKREKSRQEWEQELQRRQQNITPAQYPEGVHYARITGIPKIVSQVRFWFGIVLIAVGIGVFRSTHFPATLIAVLTIAVGLIVSVTTMR